MTSAWRGFEELQPLCDAAIEGRLTAEELRRLEQLVLENPDARRLYVEYMHQHAGLRWSVAEPDFLPQELRGNAAGWPGLRRAGPSRLQRLALSALGLAAAAVVAVAIGLGLRSNVAPVREIPRNIPPALFASLVEGKACKWDGGTLPTEVGARLGTGRLRLAEGLVRIVFDHGAEITLEAPADLELRSAQRCVLHGGRLVAKVRPAAIGFTVETPTAILKDLGTEFGVNVRDAKTSDVQVFQGLVEVMHRASGRIEQVKTEHNRRFRTEDVADFDPLAEAPMTEDDTETPETRGGRVVDISTAMGRGKDAYIQPLFPSEHFSDTLLLIKNNASEKPHYADYHRKGYIGLDLSPIAGMNVVEARLSLTFTPTGMGYASEVPDATFTVYGLTDESLDDWDENTMRWSDAPANLPGGASLDPSRVVRLGRFEIVQGELSGTRSIEGDALAGFLNQDTNGLATLILVRETQGSGRTCLVHGFASNNHPTLPPPTLRLSVTPRVR